MSTESPKAPPSAVQDGQFPQMGTYPPPQTFNSGSYPPPGTYPQYYPFPPPPEGSHNDPNNSNGGPPGPPFMMSYPPPPHGMVYAFPHPPPGQNFPQYQQQPPASPGVVRPKRKQVKMACTNCAAACKRCDEHRPCERCMKYGLIDSCVDGQRKERKRGVKRGPYKRKNKDNSVESFGAFPQQTGNGEWQQGGPPQPTPATSTTTAAIHAVAQFSPEGYPYYYAPPPGFIPAMHEGQHNQEGSPNGNGQAPPMVPYYVHPGGFPPFPYFPHHAYAPQGGPPQPPPPTLDPTAETSKKIDEQPSGDGAGEVDAAGPAGKKRGKAKNGETKTKKAKAASRLPKEKGDAAEASVAGEGHNLENAEEPPAQNGV